MHPDLRLRYLLKNASNLDEAAEALFILLNGGYVIWDDGEIYTVRHLVAKVRNIKIEVYADDHMPPHFHIRSPDLNAALRIDSCELIAGKLTGPQYALIRRWHKDFQEMLQTAWTRMRAGDHQRDA